MEKVSFKNFDELEAYVKNLPKETHIEMYANPITKEYWVKVKDKTLSSKGG